MKSLSEILKVVNNKKLRICIPAYQRGYRWGEDEVDQFIKDIWESDGAYFLQLLAVRKVCEGCLRIIDGQQRLTTCLIALRACDPDGEYPEITYESRGQNGGGLDEYFREQARKCINGKTVDKDKSKMREKILACRFLFYSVGSRHEEMALFHRLNMWKMPLRDSELVKCRIMSCCDEGVSIARSLEWDEIERQLNDNSFFSMISARPLFDQADRMGAFLRIVMNPTCAKRAEDKRAKYPLFEMINGCDDTKVSNVWDRARELLKRLRVWHGNPFCYHLIGWYLHLRRWNNESACMEAERSIFLNLDLSDAFELAKEVNAKEQGKLNFGEADEGVREYLFLANVAYCVFVLAVRYDFYGHCKEVPRSIEHIHARNQRQLEKREFDDLFKGKSKEGPTPEYAEYADKWKNSGIEAEDWLSDQCISMGVAYPNGEVDNSIGNLALLTDSMNSSFNNSPFKEKSQKIGNGWIPPLTRDVFEKRLSGLTAEEHWVDDDRTVYKTILRDLLSRFVSMGAAIEEAKA